MGSEGGSKGGSEGGSEGGRGCRLMRRERAGCSHAGRYHTHERGVAITQTRPSAGGRRLETVTSRGLCEVGGGQVPHHLRLLVLMDEKVEIRHNVGVLERLEHLALLHTTRGQRGRLGAGGGGRDCLECVVAAVDRVARHHLDDNLAVRPLVSRLAAAGGWIHQHGRDIRVDCTLVAVTVNPAWRTLTPYSVTAKNPRARRWEI